MNRILIASLVAASAATASAELTRPWTSNPQYVRPLTGTSEIVRPQFTKENRFPQPRHSEVQVFLDFIEFNDEDERLINGDANQWIATPYYRYMATEHLALTLAVPFGGLDPADGSSEYGLGDIAGGFELRAYEDVFRSAYLIPHGELRLNTGEEDAGLGDDESSLVFGLTLGSQVYDVPWFFNFDINYEVFEDAENILGLATSVIWELNERFDLVAEVGLTDEDLTAFGIDEHPIIYGGGLLYRPSEVMTVGLHGAAMKNSEEDVIVTLRFAYEL